MSNQLTSKWEIVLDYPVGPKISQASLKGEEGNRRKPERRLSRTQPDPAGFEDGVRGDKPRKADSF